MSHSKKACFARNSDLLKTQTLLTCSLTIGRALGPQERDKLIATAQLKPEWQTAFYVAVISLNTTMRGCELKTRCWRHVDLLHDTLDISRSKTSAGVRDLPLNRDACEAFVRLRARAELFGEVLPEHYVFASFKPVGRFHNREIVEHRMLNFNPGKPIGSWKKAWRNLTKQAGLPGLRFHDLRHDCITSLSNPKVSEQTVMAIAGHVSKRMLKRYSHSPGGNPIRSRSTVLQWFPK